MKESILLQIIIVCSVQIKIIMYFNKITNKNPLSDVGFIYFFLIFAYIFFPGIGILLAAHGDEFFKIALGNPSLEELYKHQWRQILFFLLSFFGFSIVRNKKYKEKIDELDSKKNKLRNTNTVVNVIFAAIFIFLVLLELLSSPVENYYEGYTRYDNLNFIVRRLLSIIINVKFGFYAIVLVIMFQNYIRFKARIIIFTVIICVFEILYSYGSRIEAFKILLMICCLYSIYVSGVKLSKIVIILFYLLFIFSIVEIARSAMINETDLLSYLIEVGVKPAEEFGALFFTGFKLYELRLNNAFPEINPLMFFYDFLAVMPFINIDEINPMVWYARNFYPNAVVPPFTLGPIAISAIYGGEIDLSVRGFILGLIIGLVSNWHSRNLKSWVVTSVYVYFYSTVVMLLKYDIFWFTSVFIKLIIPSIITIYIIDLIFYKLRHKAIY